MQLSVTAKVDKFMFTQMCECAMEINKPSIAEKWERDILNHAAHELISSMLEHGLLKLEWENYDETQDPYFIQARVTVDIQPPPDHPDAMAIWYGSLYCQNHYRKSRGGTTE